MQHPERVLVGGSVVLWKHGTLVCTCTHRPDHAIEIRLLIDDVEVDLALFTDAELASTYAISRMHAYNAT